MCLLTVVGSALDSFNIDDLNNNRGSSTPSNNSFQRFRQILIDENLINTTFEPSLTSTPSSYREEYLLQLLPTPMRATLRDFVHTLDTGREYDGSNEEVFDPTITLPDIHDLALADRAFLRLSAIYLHSSCKTTASQEAFTRFDRKYRGLRGHRPVEEQQHLEVDS